MNVEPRGFDRAALVATLCEWDLSITALSYLPLGAGSHHYLAIDSVGNQWFVTVDVLEWKLYGTFGPTLEPWVAIDLESGLDGLDRAFRTALALRDGGLEFVHAPITRADGGVLARLGDEYAVSVFPLIEGASPSYNDQDRPRLLEAVGRLHAATDTLPSELPRRWGGLAEPQTAEDWAAHTSAGPDAGINPAAVDLYRHIEVLWDVCVSAGALRSRHVDNRDTPHMWTMLQSVLSEAADAPRRTTPDATGREAATQ
jgi:hypothetical protein